MRTKDDILRSQQIDLPLCKTKEDIARVQTQVLIEVFIDIRDILDGLYREYIESQID